MNSMRTVVALACLILIGALSVKLTAQTAKSAPSIAGNYVLEKRHLPDGKVVLPPEVQGMMTLTADRRNFNVYWQQDGKPVSVSIISKYNLSSSEMSEECSYYMINDGSGKPPTYETTSSSGKSPVTIKGEKIEFQFPLHGEPKVVFDKSGMTATREGAFVDHWKKVD